jgi:hypothetical protein
MHPDSMNRDPSWDYWVEFVRQGGPTEATGWRQYVATALRLAESTYLWPFVRVPMQGRFGLYYGSVERMRAAVHDSGMMIEPSALQYDSMDQFLARNPEPERSNANPYCARYHEDWPNPRYFEALQVFRKTVDRLGGRAHFLLTPRPRNCSDELIETNAAAARSRIIDMLGAQRDLLATAPTMLPTAYFASVTHLNRYGREIYTDQLTATLASLLATSE